MFLLLWRSAAFVLALEEEGARRRGWRRRGCCHPVRTAAVSPREEGDEEGGEEEEEEEDGTLRGGREHVQSRLMYTRVGVRGWWVGKGSVVGRGFCFMMKGSGVVCKELYQDKPVRIVNLGYQLVKLYV